MKANRSKSFCSFDSEGVFPKNEHLPNICQKRIIKMPLIRFVSKQVFEKIFEFKSNDLKPISKFFNYFSIISAF